MNVENQIILLACLFRTRRSNQPLKWLWMRPILFTWDWFVPLQVRNRYWIIYAIESW